MRGEIQKTKSWQKKAPSNTQKYHTMLANRTWRSMSLKSF